jgi:hypothetical protein
MSGIYQSISNILNYGSSMVKAGNVRTFSVLATRSLTADQQFPAEQAAKTGELHMLQTPAETSTKRQAA